MGHACVVLKNSLVDTIKSLCKKQYKSKVGKQSNVTLLLEDADLKFLNNTLKFKYKKLTLYEISVFEFTYILSDTQWWVLLYQLNWMTISHNIRKT